LTYDINAFNNISSSINFRGFGFDRNSTTTATFTDMAGIINELTSRNDETNTLRSGFDWTTDYRKTFATAEQEFTMAFQLNGNVSNLESDIFSISNNPLLDFVELQNNDGDNLEYTMQADYVHPFNKSVKLEIGGKSVLRRIDSDYKYQQQEEGTENFRIDPNRTNFFAYQQDVYAGYASFNIKLPKDFGLIAGARYEHTTIGGQFDTEFSDFSNDYDNLLPSIIISKKTNQFSSLKLSYNQRIQRPTLFYVNPYRNDVDRRNITQGNPTLEPESVHQFELGYNTFVKGLVFNASVYYKNTENLIEAIVQVDEDGVARSVYENIGVDNSVGVNVFASKSFKKIITLRGNFNVFTYNAQSNLEDYNLTNDGVQFNFFTSASFNLKKNWKAEAFGFYRAPRRTLQGIQTSFWMTSVGIQKELWKKRGSLGIRIVDPFNEFKRFKTDLVGEDFTQVSDFKLPFRSFGINFRYTFGKLDFKAKNSRTKIKNNDQKGGGDGDNQGGGNFN
ncbi:MAG: outer membrane beta-barrel family protein, partial [Bacteroidota bacterium]